MEEVALATSPTIAHNSAPPATGSTSAPELRSLQSSSFPQFVPSTLADAALAQSSPHSSSSDSLSTSGDAASYTETIIEALRSKDRLYVLKVGEMIECLITDRRCVLTSCAHRSLHSPNLPFPMRKVNGRFAVNAAALSCAPAEMYSMFLGIFEQSRSRRANRGYRHGTSSTPTEASVITRRPSCD